MPNAATDPQRPARRWPIRGRRRLHLPAILCTLVLLVPAATCRPDGGLRHADAVAEISGLARLDGALWAHGDSGTPSTLYRLDFEPLPDPPTGPTSAALVPVTLRRIAALPLGGARARDWEDIAASAGRLWIADTGNNFGGRTTVELLVVDPAAGAEPPHAGPGPLPAAPPAASVRPARVPVERTLVVAVPVAAGAHGGAEWDFEALWIRAGVPWLLSKPRAYRGGPFVPGSTLLRVDCSDRDATCAMTVVATFAELDIVTAADLAPTGDRVAVLTLDAVHLYCIDPASGAMHGPGVRLFDLHPRTFPQPEALAWLDARHLLIGDEQRGMVALRLPGPASVLTCPPPRTAP